MNVPPRNLTTTLLEFIKNDLAADKDISDLRPDDDLLEGSIVDSLGIMRLITFIEKEFGFAVPSEDVVIENFLTVSAIVEYLTPKLAESNND
ncbi:MAG: acyl carrier protein [Planctomycetota bacterium]